MKKLWIFLTSAGFLYACGENNVGDRTYDLKTTEDSANYPIHNGGRDTTPTSNNNIYNPDSGANVGGVGNNASGSTGTSVNGTSGGTLTYDADSVPKVPGQPTRQ